MATVLQRVANQIGDLPARFTFGMIERPPIRRVLASRHLRALADHRASVPVLAGIDAEVLQGLERDGIHVTTLEALAIAGSSAMLRAAQDAAEQGAERARADAGEGRPFNIVSADAMMARPDIFRWGVQDRLLDIAEAYLGLPVAYDGANILYTVADGRAEATRQWHRDREDRKMLKIAVYCNDVGPGGGPFELITRLDPSQGDAQGFRYRAGSEDELARLLGTEYATDIRSCEGRAGTVVFADTARYFHRGNPVMTQDRAAVFFSYFSQRTRHPFFCERSGLSRRQIAELARDMRARQRAATLWREALPLWLRLVPPAPI